MYKKHDARAKLLFCQSKPITFLPFSLPSPPSLLKLPNGAGDGDGDGDDDGNGNDDGDDDHFCICLKESANTKPMALLRKG